jgi:hypothetical protein
VGDEIETIQLSLLEHDVRECCGCYLGDTCGRTSVVAACRTCTFSVEEVEAEERRLVENQSLESAMDILPEMAPQKDKTR